MEDNHHPNHHPNPHHDPHSLNEGPPPAIPTGGMTTIGHGIGMGRHQPTGIGIAQLPPMLGMGQFAAGMQQQQQPLQQPGLVQPPAATSPPQQDQRVLRQMNLPPATVAKATAEAAAVAPPAKTTESLTKEAPTAADAAADGEESPAAPKFTNPSGRSRTWDDNFAALVAYKQRHGNCLVPVSFPEDPALGRWCAKLRKIKETLKPERRARLEYLGFQFTNPKFAMEDKNWHDNFERLRNHYMTQDGGQKLDPTLNRWVSRQRRNKKDGILLPERAAKLDAIGFKWVIMEQKPKDYTKKDLHWIHQYNALVQFQKQTGHTNVPHGKGQYASLAKWVARQRELFMQKRLLEERKQLLNTLGFVWSMEEKAWNDNFDKLRHFVETTDSLDFQLASDPSIQRWFYAQRVKFANSNLSQERIQLLEGLGLRFDGTKAYLGGGDENRDHNEGGQGEPRPQALVPATCQISFPFLPPEGTKIRKKRFMEGWANGEVIEQDLSENRARAKVRYEDGDEEYLSEEEYRLSAIAYQLHSEPPKAARPKILVPIKRGRGRPKGSTNRNKRALPGKGGPGRPRKTEQAENDKDSNEPPPAKKVKRPDPPNLPKTPYQNIIGSAPGENQDDIYVTV